MHLASDRSYRFDVGPEELWAEIADVERFPGWWPWLRRFDANGLEVGDRWACTVQPPLPYSLTFAIVIHEVVDGSRVRASVDGEITGTAELTIEPDDAGGCTARLTSRLAPSSRFLQAIAMVARPVVSLGHDWVLDTGARQFRQQMARRPPTSDDG